MSLKLFVATQRTVSEMFRLYASSPKQPNVMTNLRSAGMLNAGWVLIALQELNEFGALESPRVLW
jgi:hypothetical protein